MIKNECLKEWINENYPSMLEEGVNNLIELDFYDMDKFADWMQEKVNQAILIPANTFNAQEDFIIEFIPEKWTKLK